jgi:DNA-binding NarL/FixJ family response regulator
MDKIKVMLVDDHRIVRDGIKSILNASDNIEVIAEAGDYETAKLLLQNSIPDIIVLDVSMPGVSGIEAAKDLRENRPDLKVIILSMYDDEDYIYNALKAGAKSYLPKNVGKRELLEAVETVYSGGEYFNEHIRNVILRSYIRKAKGGSDDRHIKEKALTKRENEVLTLFADGLSNSEIAEKLFISVRTVEAHKNNIMQKFSLKSVVDLVKFAIKQGIIKI